MNNEELLEQAIEWFTDIEEMCAKLTSGNASLLGAAIRGKAIRATEFIKKHKESICEIEAIKNL